MTPQTRTEPRALPPRVEPDAQERHAGSLRRGVLIVDDDAWIRTAMARYLRSEGIEADTCTNPEDAIRRCTAEGAQYDLVFMDIRFPEGELGYQAARRIVERCDAPPVIIGITSFANAAGDIDPAEWGMEEVIVKPLLKWFVVNLARRHCTAKDGAD